MFPSHHDFLPIEIDKVGQTFRAASSEKGLGMTFIRADSDKRGSVERK